MSQIKVLISLLLFAFFTAGCQNRELASEASCPATEVTQITEAASVSVIPETESTQPPVDHYEAYQWMVSLKADDISYVEFINLDENRFPYRRYEGDEIQEVIDLFQAKERLEYEPIQEYMPIVQWPGYYSKEFHVVMKDGTAHTVCSVYSTITVIDGTGYGTISDWLNNHWPDSGNAPLPEHWAQDAAARKYHTDKASASTLSTQSHDTQRFHLDQSYDTEVQFGSLSRHYPIGRGGIELSASGASSAGVTLSTDWTGTGGLTSLRIQPHYWLEKWQEDMETYLPFGDGQFSCESPQDFLSGHTRHWYVSWKDSLLPGHYRVGMTFYEEYNGSTQNETICYAKFSLS